MANFTERQARLVLRVIKEVTARKRCGQDFSGLASHCGVSVEEKDIAIRSAKIEQVIDPSHRYRTDL